MPLELIRFVEVQFQQGADRSHAAWNTIERINELTVLLPDGGFWEFICFFSAKNSFPGHWTRFSQASNLVFTGHVTNHLAGSRPTAGEHQLTGSSRHVESGSAAGSMANESSKNRVWISHRGK